MAGKGTGNRGGGQQASLQRMVEAAAQHHAAGRLAQAEQGYRQVLRVAPEHPVALHLLGVVAHQTGNHATAVELITRSLAAQPAYAEAHNNLGNVLRDQGRLARRGCSSWTGTKSGPGSSRGVRGRTRRSQFPDRPCLPARRALRPSLGDTDAAFEYYASGNHYCYCRATPRSQHADKERYLAPGEHGKVVVDKLPLNLVEAGVIQCAFPRARFVFVQRHPCDCALSCFMQYFQVNDAMASFLDVGDAARLYDAAMGLWQRYREVLPLAVHSVRYERLVEAFDETVSPLLEFLGVAWDDGVRDYAATARRRQDINTPSYGQVTQPLYTRARGRWERYRAHMEPALPRLLPWARTFGYDD